MKYSGSVFGDDELQSQERLNMRIYKIRHPVGVPANRREDTVIKKDRGFKCNQAKVGSIISKNNLKYQFVRVHSANNES